MTKRTDKSTVLILIIIELALLLFGAMQTLHIYRTKDVLTGNDFFNFEDIVNTGEETNVLLSDYGALERGTYVGRIIYSSEKTQRLTFNNDKIPEIEAHDIYLDHRKNEVTFRITVRYPLNNFSVYLKYKGRGDFSVNELVLKRDRLEYVRFMLVVLTVFSVLEVMLYLFYKNREVFRDVLWIMICSLIAFLPYTVSGIHRGDDLTYHLLRIDGIAEELANGHFPVYMQSIWLNGYGSPVSMYYGDFLLYFPAVLRLLGFSFNISYKLYVIMGQSFFLCDSSAADPEA